MVIIDPLKWLWRFSGNLGPKHTFLGLNGKPGPDDNSWHSHNDDKPRPPRVEQACSGAFSETLRAARKAR